MIWQKHFAWISRDSQFPGINWLITHSFHAKLPTQGTRGVLEDYLLWRCLWNCRLCLFIWILALAIVKHSPFPIPIPLGSNTTTGNIIVLFILIFKFFWIIIIIIIWQIRVQVYYFYFFRFHSRLFSSSLFCTSRNRKSLPLISGVDTRYTWP